MLHVVPPLIDKVLQTVNSDTLRLRLSTVCRIMSGAVGLSNNTARQILQLLPGVQLQQSEHGSEKLAIYTLVRFDVQQNIDVL